MDVKQYYRKIREVETSIPDEFPLVVSVDTSDGGKAGKISEVSRPVAAKMIVEGRAILATPKDRTEYHEWQATAKRAAEKAELARRVHVAIIADSDLQLSDMGRNNNEPKNNGK